MDVFSTKKYLKYITEKYGESYAERVKPWWDKLDGMTAEEIEEGGYAEASAGMTTRAEWISGKCLKEECPLVFSKKKALESFEKNSAITERDADNSWTDACDGKTEEEMIKLGYGAVSTWMVSKQQWFADRYMTMKASEPNIINVKFSEVEDDG